MKFNISRWQCQSNDIVGARFIIYHVEYYEIKKDLNEKFTEREREREIDSNIS